MPAGPRPLACATFLHPTRLAHYFPTGSCFIWCLSRRVSCMVQWQWGFVSEYIASCFSDCALPGLLSIETTMGLFKQLVCDQACCNSKVRGIGSPVKSQDRDTPFTSCVMNCTGLWNWKCGDCSSHSLKGGPSTGMSQSGFGLDHHYRVLPIQNA